MTSKSTVTQVFDVITAANLAENPSSAEWVRLDDVRAAVPNLGRREVDQALIRLFEDKRLHVAPEENRASLTASQREAALWLGGGYIHYVMLTARPGSGR
ncbi:hypothetical protein [Haloglycomyces albus]|uniref:hypothetical protein n=1 Tax=Haloglycomyces albus TaxID=526067 RepID=UPI0004B9CBAA|nr:hypothetical protein [Haloglycomyces albus]